MDLKRIIQATILSSVLITSPLLDLPARTTSKFIWEEIRCMELNLHHEARGESTKGIIAVANVTLNRVRSGKFAKSICEVVRQKGQFSWTVSAEAWKLRNIAPKIREIAYNSVLYNKYSDVTGGALYFHHKDIETPFDRKRVAEIGDHIFYK